MGRWQLVAPSAQPYFMNPGATHQRALTQREIERIVKAFGFAAKVVVRQLDAIEIQATWGISSTSL